MGVEKKSVESRGWLKLDNAAKLFPSITSKELTSVFRISAFLKEPVKLAAVIEAVKITSKRFPYFSVSLGSGFFWHYLELNQQLPRIQAEEAIPCTAFAVNRKNEPLYRVLVKKNRLSVEFIHILSDGSGAFEYLKSLLYTYLKLTGKTINSTEGIIIPESPLSDDEMEDGYNRFFNKKLPPSNRLSKAWHLPFKLNKKPRLRVLHSEIDLPKLIEITHAFNVTITEYLVSVYLFSLQKIYLEEKSQGRRIKKSILRTEVPINLRKKFPSRTMRNFSLFVMPEIDLRLGFYLFEDVLKTVHHSIQAETDVKQINRIITRNVKPERNLLVRVLPLFIKRVVISTAYKKLGANQYTGVITNLGAVQLPPDMGDHVDSFAIVPPPPNTNIKVCCGIMTFKDKLRIVFCNLTVSNELEKHFHRFLVDSGIPVKILSNE
jgi:NRPS condensation-like uncharacterized protein